METPRYAEATMLADADVTARVLSDALQGEPGTEFADASDLVAELVEGGAEDFAADVLAQHGYVL